MSPNWNDLCTGCLLLNWAVYVINHLQSRNVTM